PESLSFTSCPDPQWVPLDENCQVVVPDFTEEVTTNYQDAIITQDPPGGTVLQGVTSLRIEMKATREEEEAFCHVTFQAGDRTDPVIVECPKDQNVSYDPEVGFVLPNYTSLVQALDSCGEVSFSQAPNPGN